MTVTHEGVPDELVRLPRWKCWHWSDGQKEPRAVSKATGIPESTFSRFVAGENVLQGEDIDKLADYLGLALTAKAGKARKDR
jgi:hypothetical protein